MQSTEWLGAASANLVAEMQKRGRLLGTDDVPPSLKGLVSGDEELLGKRQEREIMRLAAQHDSVFLEKYVFGPVDASIRQRLKSASSSQELWQAQGALLLLDQIKDVLAAATKKKKVQK